MAFSFGYFFRSGSAVVLLQPYRTNWHRNIRKLELQFNAKNVHESLFHNASLPVLIIMVFRLTLLSHKQLFPHTKDGDALHRVCSPNQVCVKIQVW